MKNESYHTYNELVGQKLETTALIKVIGSAFQIYKPQKEENGADIGSFMDKLLKFLM